MHFDTTQLNNVNVTASALYVKEAHSWSCTQNPGPVYRFEDYDSCFEQPRGCRPGARKVRVRSVRCS